MSLRTRLVAGIVALLSVLWALAAVWFFLDLRSELRDVLDARLAASARMVQGLIERGDLRLPPPTAQPAAPSAASPLPALPADLSCQLWTRQGRLITASRGAPAVAAGAIPDGYSNRTVAGESWRVYALTDAASGVRILTSERRGLRIALVRDLATAVSAPFLLVLPAMVFLVWLVVRRALGPLERLRRSIQARAPEALEAIPERDIPPEVGPLVAAINGLFARLSGVLERERRFTGDAAHELRTPLAGIKTQLQIARAAEGPIRERALAQAEAGLDRMSRLVEQMLLLSRLEAQPPSGSEPGTCDPVAETRAVFQDLQNAAGQRGVTLTLAGEPGGATLPPSMLHAVLRNLVENAVRHAAKGGQVMVEVERGPAGVEMRVIDDGPGIPPEELSQVTRRFYRTAATDGPGTGLGLAIVTAIAQRYGLGLSLENRREATGLIARLQIPGGQ
ncbi:MAG: ATP-binding protein [Candidatus Bathyarchaeota archaeon]